MRRWAAVVLLSALVSGCVASGEPSPSVGPTGSVVVPGAPTVAASEPGGTPQPSPSILDSVPFAGASLHLPAGWRAMSYQNVSSFSELVAYLGPDLVPDPCSRYANGSSCSWWQTTHLPPNGVVAAVWRWGGPPGAVLDMTSGDAVTIAGRPGRFVTVEVDPGCRAMGGDEQLKVIVPNQAIWNWEQLDACLRGPDHAAGEATIRSMITDLTPGPTEEPMNSDATIPQQTGYVSAPGQLRLQHVTLSFPASWNARRLPISTFDPVSRIAIAALGPQPIPTCLWALCDVWPPLTLDPNGIVVTVWARDSTDWTLDGAAGTPITVAGQPAKLAVGPADSPCAQIGGEELMTTVIPDEPVRQNFAEIDACLRGPDLRTNEALVRGILALGVATPVWSPDETASPSP